MTKTIQINLQFIFIEKFTGRRASLHRSKVLAPSGPASIFLQSFLFSSSKYIKISYKFLTFRAISLPILEPNLHDSHIESRVLR